MVALRGKNGWPMLVVDVVGGGAVVAFVMVFLWLTLVRTDGAAARGDALTRSVRSTRQDLARARAARDELRVLRSDREAELLRTGRLPARAPVEEYFQLLSRLAARNRLRVVRQRPVASQSYPGLFEQRYVYEVAGSLVDVTRFLRDIEYTKYWADVSHFRIGSGRGGYASAPGEGVAVLTLSLFSAPPAEQTPEDG